MFEGTNFTFCLVVFLQLLYVTHALDCRVCHRIERLDECTETQTCTAGDECFMDELITLSGIRYEGGCRPVDVCQSASSSVHIGRRSALLADDKRDANDLVACSRCCSKDRDLASGLECNAKLCGLRSNLTGFHQCYSCNNVLDANECTSLTTCQYDEVCGATTHLNDKGHTFDFGCYPQFCIGQTKVLLAFKTDLNLVTPSGPNQVVPVGKRDVTGCRVCCADPYCNTNNCKVLLNKLYALKQNGHLDLNTLHYKP